ncbi:hypothetical protein BO70DRAFT_426091 [Aspergillus heteromorphus CBS 117.55]|uniref:Inner kinetochore subunit AME1 domain-containing protein n=1 Tax=Aspergillus heteromorphus CBS 117.55 TaxID=1448321 RepID=A0A317WXV3_9EURO|nr:uncharacterized protein BO70DRAFT_426091 [Aspergillus heteromorphus CBS 117.55]PWY91203.1 hypothetical protein BO70DRAFT_426091 [Aspergillus heteromorphus CBS 117.55]
MASNREERQQMRQRGAALRKTKAVDFGFSFGMTPAADEESQPASRPGPADVGIALEAPAPPPPPPTITTTTTDTTATTTAAESANTPPPIVSPERNPLSPQGSIRRTPGSARNKRPPRPDTFDIPTEEPPDVGPSRKIRKLSHPVRTSTTTSLGARDEDNNSQSLQNGVDSSATAHLPKKPPTIDSAPPIEEQQPQEIPSVTPVVSEDAVPEQTNGAAAISEPKTAAKSSSPIPQEPPQTNGTPSPPGQKTKGKRKRRTSRDSEGSSRRSSRRTSPRNSASPKSADVNDELLSEPMDMSSDGIPETAESPTTAVPEPPEQDSIVLKKVTEPPVVAGSQASAEIQVTDSQATAEVEIASQPQVAAEKQPAAEAHVINEPELTTEPQIVPEPEVDEPEVAEPEAIEPKATEPEVITEPQIAIEPESATETNEITQLQDGAEPLEATEPEQIVEPQGITAETRSTTPPRAKRTRGKRAASAQPPSSTVKVPRVARAGSVESAPVQAKESKRLRGRFGRAQKPTSDVPVIEEEPAEKPEEVEVTSEPKDDTTSRKETRQQRLSQSTVADKKPKRAGRPGRKATRPQDIQEETRQPEVQKGQEQVQLPGPEAEAEPELEPEAEPVPEPETEQQPEPPQEPEPSRPARRGRRKQPPSKKKDATRVATEEPTAQVEPTEETQPEPVEEIQPEPAEEVQPEPVQEAPLKKRKPRQPRGETVPVTVHRLANAASLRGILEQDSSDEEEEPTDEISARQKAKLPNRGGVNAADVLGQICRETLEKTLTTLKNGIAGETNAARRAEWTRKKKAVEAYGTELEGRLFELSEMLDSNFVLGRQVKKAKRDMMDTRSRLYQVRKEREAIALQMDAVRRKHTEDESAKMARSTINNSLHSLDLALERNRPAPESMSDSTTSASASTAGLEFLLRNVADNVSSVAPGAQGGLLHQIRSFNAQLEATARRLES